LRSMQLVAQSDDPETREMMNGPLFTSELTYRTLRFATHKDDEMPPPPPWEGITWILDLLPHWPGHALQSLGNYVLAHAQFLPDGRATALGDASAVIRDYYIGSPETSEERRQFLCSINPRMFEALVAALYESLGYAVELTVQTGDGGRDIVATRTDPTRRSQLQIQCKRWEKKVGVEKVRELLGVVSRHHATTGTLVATSSFTRGAVKEAGETHRIELINGAQLVVLLNEHLGQLWPTRIDQICQPKMLNV
jgi:restriction system protein